MLQIDNKATQIDHLLDEMAKSIQLDKTRKERMVSSYEAVKNWIESDEMFFKPNKYDVYPHGSVRILTTVKPFKGDEFDLDIAVHIRVDWKQHSPTQIYNELKRRLQESAEYNAKLELKKRCIRLNYAGDYHIDILPGVQETLFDDNKLKVPDRELGDWVSSSPRGYAEWFLAKANLVQESLLEKAIRAEKLPADSYDNKKPLQRAVQLIKRYRDVFFQEDDEYKTSSIVLTTIAGQFYRGQESIFDTVDGIITTIQQQVINLPSRLKVVNPVNEEEDFTDKWDEEPEFFFAFTRFSAHLYQQWQKLKMGNGVPEEGAIMKGLFGNELYEQASVRQTQAVDYARKNKNLAISRQSGILTSTMSSAASKVAPNTFYGK